MSINAKSIVIQLLTYTVGNTLVFLQPKRAERLSKKGLTLVIKNDLSITDRLMRNAILNKVERKQDFDTLADLHKNYWTNKGEDFFLETEAAFKNDFLPNCSFIFNELKNNFLISSSQFHTLVEIGTGNGYVLDYLSSIFPSINEFVGIDLSSAQIKINEENFKENKKLTFIASDGFDWVKKHGQDKTIFVTSKGVLEYFTQQRLQAFLIELNKLNEVIFVAIEPNDTHHDFTSSSNSMLYGYERSFSHNYPKLFKDANFSIWHLSQKPSTQGPHLRTFIGANTKDISVL